MTLSILIWLPLAISLVASQLPRALVGRVVAVGSLVTLGIAISFVARFQLGHAGLQFVTDQVWISALGIHYKLGLDGLNVALILLTTILFSAALIWAALRDFDRPRIFYFHFGLAQSAVLAAFCAQDLALFVAFFDLMLIPFYFLIGMWGSGERVFSGVVSKVAAYGFLRIVLPLFPYATVHFQMLMLVIALVSILWATAVAFTTPDARLVVAYSSVAQLGFITLGIFSLRPQGAQGAVLQMVNHGLVTAPLFFIVAALAARAGGSELLRDMGGIAFRAPVLAALFLIVTLATLAMPGSSNFAGEFLILLGVFKSKMVISIIAFSGVVGAAYYALRMFIGAMHNRVRPGVDSREIGWSDLSVLVPLVGVILVLAFYPQFVLKRTEPSVKASVAAASAGSATSTQVASR